MDNIAENRAATFCRVFFLLVITFVVIGMVGYALFQLLQLEDLPTIPFIAIGIVMCLLFTFLIVSIIIRMVALIRGKPIPTSILDPSHQSQQLVPSNIQADTGPNCEPQVMTYGPTSSMGGQLAPMVLYLGPLPNNQLSGSNPNSGPYFETITTGPSSGPHFSGLMGPSPGSYNPNMGPTHASFPSAPSPLDLGVNPPSYADVIKKK